ncbi:MAG: hypothetical protein EXR72_19255 [Myxococcales bacterium]|nr:hypothetical protein [Myxococcales bacterium]
MSPAADPNLDLLRTVPLRLGPLRERVVFLGGSAIGLLVTDAAAGTMRPTIDVDLIVEVRSLADYQVTLRDQLRGLGFVEDTSKGAPLCRWLVDGVKVDIMPTRAAILGFANRWYVPALRHATERTLAGGSAIRLVTAPYFIATKLDAFRGRGEGDFAASHDLEDGVTVVDGRAELLEELEQSSRRAHAGPRAVTSAARPRRDRGPQHRAVSPRAAARSPRAARPAVAAPPPRDAPHARGRGSPRRDPEGRRALAGRGPTADRADFKRMQHMRSLEFAREQAHEVARLPLR